MLTVESRQLSKRFQLCCTLQIFPNKMLEKKSSYLLETCIEKLLDKIMQCLICLKITWQNKYESD